jgi:hypothetical protein
VIVLYFKIGGDSPLPIDYSLTFHKMVISFEYVEVYDIICGLSNADSFILSEHYEELANYLA